MEYTFDRQLSAILCYSFMRHNLKYIVTWKDARIGIGKIIRPAIPHFFIFLLNVVFIYLKKIYNVLYKSYIKNIVVKDINKFITENKI